MKTMSTHATIYFMNEEFGVSHDGSPHGLLPLLNEMKKKAREYAEQHQIGFDEALWVQFHTKVSEGQLTIGGYSNRYSYSVWNCGCVQMLNDQGEWFDLIGCHDDYIELNVAFELDDVDSSLSTMQARNERVGEIRDVVPGDLLENWDEEIHLILSQPDITCASGANYN